MLPDPNDFVVVGVGAVPATGLSLQVLLTTAVGVTDVLAFQAAVLLPSGELAMSLPSHPVVVRSEGSAIAVGRQHFFVAAVGGAAVQLAGGPPRLVVCSASS